MAKYYVKYKGQHNNTTEWMPTNEQEIRKRCAKSPLMQSVFSDMDSAIDWITHKQWYIGYEKERLDGLNIIETEYAYYCHK